MLKLKYILVAGFLTTTLLSTGAPVDSTNVIVKEKMHDRASGQLLNVAWGNPVIKQFERNYSYSNVGVNYSLRDENVALDPQQGNKESVWAFDADTYMKYKNSTLWGRAYYNNGQINNMVWNETSETQMVYPYLLADSVGGKKMNLERYSFMGGYASFNGKLAWGGTLGYTAGLYYRNVDPRPRNVTANLDIQAGVGYLVWKNYLASVSLNFKKYKQTNEVSFYSELGNEKIFHLTGFTNEYTRFGGTGLETYYNGHKYGVTMNVHPVDNKGLSASISASQFNFDNVLTGLNKLPMAHVKHNDLTAELGWLRNDWGVVTHLMASRRKGTENVFGDPASSVYMQIGSLDMYYENKFEWGVAGFWEQESEKYYVSIKPNVDYHHYNELYYDPHSRLLLNDINYGLQLKGGAEIGRTWNALNLGFNYTSPIKSEMTLSSATTELTSLQQIIENKYNWQKEGRWEMQVGVSSAISISQKYAIKASINWTHGKYANTIHRNNLFTSISLVF